MSFTFKENPDGTWMATQEIDGKVTGDIGPFPTKVEAKLFCWRLICDEGHALHHPSGHGRILITTRHRSFRR